MWEYTVQSNGNYNYSVMARCSICGWNYFSRDGVGNYDALFAAFIIDYRKNPSAADEWLVNTAKKLQQFNYCPICGTENTKEREDQP